MNLSNLKALDSKAANRAVADSRAGVASRKIRMNRNVSANSASAGSSLAAAKGAVAAKNVAAANKAAANKAADDKSLGKPRRLVVASWNNERREATPAAFLGAYHRRFGVFFHRR
jgi:hypothetical protein